MKRGGARDAGKGRMELGMQSFVAQVIDMYRGGFDSRRMLLQACRCCSFHDGVGLTSTSVCRRQAC